MWIPWGETQKVTVNRMQKGEIPGGGGIPPPGGNLSLLLLVQKAHSPHLSKNKITHLLLCRSKLATLANTATIASTPTLPCDHCTTATLATIATIATLATLATIATLEIDHSLVSAGVSRGSDVLTLSLLSSKSVFSQPFKKRLYEWCSENL